MNSLLRILVAGLMEGYKKGRNVKLNKLHRSKCIYRFQDYRGQRQIKTGQIV